MSDAPLIAGTEQKTPFVNGTLQSKKEGHNLNTNMVVRVPKLFPSKTPDTDGGTKATLPPQYEPRLGGGGKEANIVAGFSFGQSAKARSLGYQEEVSPTVRGGEGGNQKPHIVIHEK